jgi:catecholate siderophore receptor
MDRSPLTPDRELTRKLAPIGTLAAAVACALQSFTAHAQSERLETLVVEGRELEQEVSQGKFTAPLLDTPKSVTVIPSQLMEQRGATSLVDALKSVPGVTFNAGEGGQPAGDNLKIRGFDAGADVFVDGVRDAGSQSRDIFALEQVEVIKGPGSAYTGRGSTGGSVNLVTKKAQAEDFLVTRLGAGTDEFLRGSLDANHSFGERAAFRLNVLSQGGDVPGRNEVFLDHRGIAPSLAFGLGTPTRINLDYYYYRTDDMPDYSMPYTRNADNTDVAGAPVDVDRDNFYGLLNRDFQKTGADIRTLEIEHDIGNRLTLRNIMRYGETSNDYIVTNPDDGRGNVPNGYVLRNSKSRNSETTTRANITDVYGTFMTGRVEHSIAVGLEISSEEMYNRNYFVEALFNANAVTAFANSCSAPGAVGATSNYNCTTLVNPNPHDPWSGTIAPSGSATLAEADTRSVYAFDTLGFNEQWSLNVGVRYDDYETRQWSGAVDAPTRLDNAADFVNHQLGLVYKPVANGSLYLSTATSSNPSGNTLGDGTENLGSSNADLEPERNRSHELGVKWALLDDRLQVTSALFRTEKTNARVSIEPGRSGAQENLGTQEVDGFEVGAVGNIGSAWQVLASYTYLDSVIGDDGPIGANDGNEFPNTPRNSASLWTSYAFDRGVTVGAGANYVDQRFGDADNSIWAPSYITYDAMASFPVGQHTSLQLNLQNLTDEVYFVRPYQAHYASIGPARSAVLSVNLEF